MTAHIDTDTFQVVMDLVRDQLRHGYLTTAGIHATRDALTEQLDDLPADLAADALWLLDQLDAELAIRRLDPGGDR